MAPTYDKDIERLLRYYREALRKISAELNRLDLTDFSRANITATQKEIAQVIVDLDENMRTWVAEIVPKATEDGVILSMIALGVADTVEDAQKVASFNRLNREFIKTAVADMQDDLLQVTQNVERKVRTAVRQVTAEAMRSNLTQGLNTIDAIKPDILRGLKAQLGDALHTGIIDAAGRRWRPEVYVQMVTETKLAQTQRESAINEAIGREAYYGIISSHGAKDMCRNWEGKVVKLTADAPGDFPYYGSLPNREIFHPRCKHVISPFRRPDRLPDEVKERNNIQ